MHLPGLRDGPRRGREAARAAAADGGVGGAGDPHRRRGAGENPPAAHREVAGGRMITTHVLDTAQGRPAAGVPVELDIRDGAGWKRLGAGHTDPDGRVRTLLPAGPALPLRTYPPRLETRRAFFPEVCVIFAVRDAGAPPPPPLVLSP